MSHTAWVLMRAMPSSHVLPLSPSRRSRQGSRGACPSNDPGRRYIVNFSRERIFGAGVGHFSPIGGYLEAEDLVFIRDVNSDYQPWLVASKRLFDAVNPLTAFGSVGFC